MFTGRCCVLEASRSINALCLSSLSMKKALLAAHPTSIAVATVLFMALCSAALIVVGVVYALPPPTHHHHAVVAELRRLSTRLDHADHYQRMGIDGVGLRLAEVHAELDRMVGALKNEDGVDP